MHRRVVEFVGPRQIQLRDEAMEGPRQDQVLVRTKLSAISAGTEMLLYRGEIPSPAASKVDLISSGLRYPMPYGYCAVGEVAEIGRSVDGAWLGKLVFGFEPHASHFLAAPEALLLVPEDLGEEQAVFLPNTETAANVIQDAAPILGERVLVLGQGVVGLLSAALLREFPLECLVTADRFAVRRQASEALGVTAVLDPIDPGFRAKALAFTGGSRQGYDASIELTGNPSALNDAVALTTFSGRLILGSWFGSKSATLDLGGAFHRSRIRLLASQVSTIAPELTGRWNKERRFLVAWEAIRRIRPGQWITHRFPVERAEEAYRLLDQSPGEAIQVVFEY